jgi:DNA-binding transcriptional regulator YhcF (GntR family)
MSLGQVILYTNRRIFIRKRENMGSTIEELTVAAKKREDLQFSIDLKSGVPQLPTVRSLAVDLKINPNTVAKAYNQLELRGIVTTQQGTGTFIADREVKMDDIERERILAELSKSFLTKAASYGFTLQEVVDHLREIESKE